jgi:hypothetical protein
MKSAVRSDFRHLGRVSTTCRRHVALNPNNKVDKETATRSVYNQELPWMFP